MEIARLASSAGTIPQAAAAMVYVEEEVGDDLDSALSRWVELIEPVADDFEPLVFEGEARLREARRIRHSIPSTMNERGGRYRDSGGRKVSTDWAVPYRKLPEAIATARSIAERLKVEHP